jgi:hypothetical protein
MTTHIRYRFIGVAMVLAHLFIALFAILLAAIVPFDVYGLGRPKTPAGTRATDGTF